VYQGRTYTSAAYTFATKNPDNVSFSWTVNNVTPGETDARFVYKCESTSAAIIRGITEQGIYLNGQLMYAEDKTSNPFSGNYTYFNENVTANGQGCYLSTGTTYSYYYYLVYQGRKYVSDTYTFTTGGPVPGYTLRLDAAGGSVGTSSVTVTVGSADYSELTANIPVRAGYTFAGWYYGAGTLVYNAAGYNVNDGTFWKDGQWKYNGNVTLSAAWTANVYTLIFDAKNGSAVSGKQVTFGAAVGDTPVPALTGCTFAGWFSPSDGGQISAGTTVTWTEDRTVEARWTANSYTLSFNANGGSVSAASKQVVFGQPVGIMPVPVRSGYAFAGWYDASGNHITSAVNVSWAGNITVTAVWIPECYTIILDANGGSANAAQMSVIYGQMVGSLPVPVRAGYRFTGWFDSNGAELSQDTIYNTAADKSVKAGWAEIMVTGITLNRTSLQLSGGESFTLTASVTPDGAHDKSVAWSSSNSSVASVNGGTVTAKGAGSCVITAVCGSVSASCTVTVNALIDAIGLDRSSISLAVSGIGAEFPLEVSVTPSDAECEIVFSSSDTSVARVSPQGVVTAVAAGRAVVTAEAAGVPPVSCVVNVSDLSLMTLPSMLKEIGSEAFSWVRSNRIVVPDGAVRICARAFADNPSLYFIHIPESVTEIADDAFDGDANVCLTAASGSYAETWAKAHGVKYISDSAGSFVPVSGIEMPAALSIAAGCTACITAKVTPSDATDATIVWSSDNENAATVTSQGEVTAAKPGTAIIRASAADGSGVTAQCTVTVTASAGSSVALSKSRLELSTGASAYLTAETVPAGGTVSWSSGDASVASVSDDGLVTAVAPGNTYIRADFGGASAECQVTVSSVPVSRITLDAYVLDLYEGDARTLTASVFPSSAACMSIAWVSDNTAVAVVENGTVTAVSSGSAVITASATDGSGVSASCTVSVSRRLVSVTSIGLSAESISLLKGEYADITAAVLPGNASDKSILWSTDNASVAGVSDTGRITAIGTGSCVITASACDDSGLSASLRVTVSDGVQVTFTDLPSYESTGSNNAVIAKSVSVGGAASVSDVTLAGCYMYNSEGVTVGLATFAPQISGGVINLCCNAAEDLGAALSPLTTYSYRFTVVIGGSEYSSRLYYVTTGDNPVTVSFGSCTEYEQLGSKNAVVAKRISVSGASISDVTLVGCEIFDMSGTRLGAKTDDKITPVNNGINAFYNVNTELKTSLSPSTSYKYRISATINGVTYYSEYFTLTTLSSQIPIMVSHAYLNGPYYTKLVNAINTYGSASQSELFVQIALSQKGYKSGTSTGDYSGTGTGARMYAEYLLHTGLKADQWCASFVSWCARMAGVSTNVVAQTALARTMKSRGAVYDCWNSDFTGSGLGSYVPKRGDLAVFMPTGSNGYHVNTHAFNADGTTTLSAHVVIITSAEYISDGVYRLTTIERGGSGSISNLGNTVWTRTVATNELDGGGNAWIQAIIHPNWSW